MDFVHPEDRDRVLSEAHIGAEDGVDTEFRVFTASGEVLRLILSK